MGVYLSTPKTDKASADGENGRVRFGLSSMQGWRTTMEDAVSLLLILSLFPIEFPFDADYLCLGGRFRVICICVCGCLQLIRVEVAIMFVMCRFRDELSVQLLFPIVWESQSRTDFVVIRFAILSACRAHEAAH